MIEVFEDKFQVSCFSFVALAMIFSMPLSTFAQQNPGRGEAERTAAEDTQAVVLQAKADAKRDVNNDFNASQFEWSAGGCVVVTASSLGGAYLGCLVGTAFVTRRRSDPSVDEVIFAPEIIYGCLWGWCIGFTGSVYGIYKLGGRVPVERLIGKSPEYVEAYTKIYKRKIGVKRAAIAGFGSALLWAAFFPEIL